MLSASGIPPASRRGRLFIECRRWATLRRSEQQLAALRALCDEWAGRRTPGRCI